MPPFFADEDEEKPEFVAVVEEDPEVVVAAPFPVSFPPTTAPPSAIVFNGRDSISCLRSDICGCLAAPPKSRAIEVIKRFV